MWKKSRKTIITVATGLLVVILAVGFAYSFPVDLALLAAIDVSAYVDALVGVYLVASVVKIRPMLRLWARRISGAFGRASRRRGPIARIAKPSDTDDDPAVSPHALRALAI